MPDILYTNTLSEPELLQLIHACDFPQEAFFLGEQLPDHIVDNRERENLLLFTWYASNLPFSSYTTGCIFHAEEELRWERSEDTFQIVYLGSKQYKHMSKAHPSPIEREFIALINDGKLEKSSKQYILFGKFLAQDPKTIATPENHQTYAEVRIPRLLHYPLPRSQRKPNIERVQIAVTEYTDKDSGQIFTYRFCALQQYDQTEQAHKGV